MMKCRAFLIALLAIFVMAGCSQKQHYAEFSSENWKVAEIKEREGMAKDLISKDILIGKTHDEVVFIMGKDGIIENGNFDGFQFVVGQSYIDFILLNILFDSDGHVSKVFITQS